MNGNFKYTLDDDQRVRLQAVITGKRKAATRAEVCSFLQGCLDGALAEHEPAPIERTAMPEWAQKESERLRALGKDESYIRGWLQVMARGRAA